VIGLTRGVVDGRKEVLALKEGVILQDLVERSPGPEKLQHVANANPLPANAGTAATFAFLDSDAVQGVPDS